MDKSNDQLAELRALAHGGYATLQAAADGARDVYNLLNSAPVLDQNTRYGTSWLQPLEIFGARFLKVGVQLDF